MLGNLTSHFATVRRGVRRGLEVCGVAMLTYGCASTPPDVGKPLALAWTETLAPYLITPVFPPREDLQVGDVYIVCNMASLQANGAPAPSYHLARMSVADVLTTYYAGSINLPKSIDDPGAKDGAVAHSPFPSQAAPSPMRLRNVSLPEFFTASVNQAGINAVLPWGISLSALGINSKKTTSVAVSIPSAASYGLSLAEVGQVLTSNASLLTSVSYQWSSFTAAYEKKYCIAPAKASLFLVYEVYVAYAIRIALGDADGTTAKAAVGLTLEEGSTRLKTYEALAKLLGVAAAAPAPATAPATAASTGTPAPAPVAAAPSSANTSPIAPASTQLSATETGSSKSKEKKAATSQGGTAPKGPASPLEKEATPAAAPALTTTPTASPASPTAPSAIPPTGTTATPLDVQQLATTAANALLAELLAEGQTQSFPGVQVRYGTARASGVTLTRTFEHPVAIGYRGIELPSPFTLEEFKPAVNMSFGALPGNPASSTVQLLDLVDSGSIKQPGEKKILPIPGRPADSPLMGWIPPPTSTPMLNVPNQMRPCSTKDCVQG